MLSKLNAQRLYHGSAAATWTATNGTTLLEYTNATTAMATGLGTNLITFLDNTNKSPDGDTNPAKCAHNEYQDMQ